MTNRLFLFTAFLLFAASLSHAQKDQRISLTSTAALTPVNVQVVTDTYLGKQAMRVVDTARGVTSEVKYAKIKDLQFSNGVIELDVAGKPLGTAVQTARGFVGIAFHINDDNSRFECIYLRPTNGRADDQVRRNHSVQYVSYPDYPWERSRKETPEKYESYVDLVAGEWTKVRIEVQGDKARLYVHGAAQPTLIINDLKHGANQEGAIGLWVGSGTDAHFTNLTVTKQP